MSLFSAALHPNVGLGFIILGASLHDILTRLKAEPQRFPKLDLGFTPSEPVTEPVVLTLPANGIRLRFDGPEQRLRLIEIIDFTKNRITYQDKDIAKPSSSQGVLGSPRPGGETATGPAFKNVYHRLFGPTYAGEYMPADDDKSNSVGTYVLSYPGVAFNFPLPALAYSPDKDVVSLLSSSASQTASSMAIFSGKSWQHAREHLWDELLPSVNSAFLFSKSKEMVPDEISLVKIHGGGRLQLFKKWTSASMWINLGETTPQDLVAELGPPDAIYRKNDQRMHIHKTRTASHSRSRSDGRDYKRPDDLTDTDQSSAHTGSDDSDDEAIEDEAASNVSGECFYNYFYLGFDVLVSPPQTPSPTPPGQAKLTGENDGGNPFKNSNADRLVATKVVLHANVPGSYPFNRHRRCRWEIAYLDHPGSEFAVDSETPFNEMEERLREEWKSTYTSEDDAKRRQRGMVLNRGWGDSPGSSCEFLGGWEDSTGGMAAKKFDGNEDSTTTLYGFPGLVFEVLKNGFVSAVTVF
ncbi:Uu.00g027390.m01.CDS01 [Anthostomella pinea]|uniref:Uu.00g027390.m01.CDS01 n=1 Tax=Anthostomella pinea TaxID=933095 RepID=A0AAI8V8Q8_9PEZI|nr:Uu.00g027390.m01.CDS01 [Anthostomella pinea]